MTARIVSYKKDREFARSTESTLEEWYKSLPWVGTFWREPDGTTRQRQGVDVNFVLPDADPDGVVYTIDEKASRTDRPYITFEVMQDTEKPGWGQTALNDYIVFTMPRKEGGRKVWWISMEGLRDYARFLPPQPLDFSYAKGVVKHTIVKYADLEALVRGGEARGPFLIDAEDQQE